MTSPGRRCPIASPTRPEPVLCANDLPWDQLTIFRLQASSTTARHRNPFAAGTKVMSATQSLSRPTAVKSRSTRSGAGRASCLDVSSSHLSGGDWRPSTRRPASGARSACGRAGSPWPEARRGSSVTHTSRARSREQFGPVSRASCLQSHGPMPLAPARRDSRTPTRRARGPWSRSETPPDSRS